MKPSAELRVAATQVRIAASTGAPHGAATNPDTSPMISAPVTLPPTPVADARARRRLGIGTGITSAIMPADASITFAMANCSHGFVLTVPNIVPVRPARRPSPAYAAASPTTYTSTRPTRRHRLAVAAPAPTIDTVIGIIG